MVASAPTETIAPGGVAVRSRLTHAPEPVEGTVTSQGFKSATIWTMRPVARVSDPGAIPTSPPDLREVDGGDSGNEPRRFPQGPCCGIPKQTVVRFHRPALRNYLKVQHSYKSTATFESGARPAFGPSVEGNPSDKKLPVTEWISADSGVGRLVQIQSGPLQSVTDRITKELQERRHQWSNNAIAQGKPERTPVRNWSAVIRARTLTNWAGRHQFDAGQEYLESDMTPAISSRPDPRGDRK